MPPLPNPPPRGEEGIRQGAPAVVAVEHLRKAYRGVVAVDDLSFSVGAGEIFGLLGPNGAGKTTTLAILEGLRLADAGEARIFGLDVHSRGGEIKARIGVQLQQTSLIPDLKVAELVELFGRLYGRALSAAEVVERLAQLGLAEAAGKLPRQLSGGQQKRLALVLALVNDPELLFLDEPTAGLDPLGRRVVWQVVREQCERGQTVVLTTHSMEEAEAMCHRVGIMNRGKLLALDTPGALVNQFGGDSTISSAAHLDLQRMRALAGVVDVREDGVIRRLEVSDVALALTGLLDLARQQGVALDDLTVRQPSLDDVLLRLITDHDNG